MLPPSVQSLIEIFNSELADVRFGEMDAKGLEQLASEVQSATEAVATAQGALDAARAKLAEQQESMLLQAQRALAYARIYAEANAPLRARLDAIALPRAAKRTKAEEAAAKPAKVDGETEGSTEAEIDASAPPRKRGRPRKAEAGAEETATHAAE